MYNTAVPKTNRHCFFPQIRVPYFPDYTSHPFLHETSHPKNGVQLTIEMQLTYVFRDFCKIDSQTCICIRSIYEESNADVFSSSQE